MKLQFIPLDKLFVDRTNMRYGKKAPDVSDLLPTVLKRGVLQTLLVKPADGEGKFGIVAGARRFHAGKLAAEQLRAEGEAEPYLLPCGILADGDDAGAIEASLIENAKRLDPDEVSQWESFVRLVREGRTIADISETFGIPELGVKRTLALGNLLPRVRDLYRRDNIDAATVRHLTLASKHQQQAWLALFDDPATYCPSGHQLKAWLFGGQSIKVEHALFDAEASGLAIVADLFGEDRYFADADAFWTAQDAAIEERKDAYLEDGWANVVIVPRGEHFSSWEYAKAPKRKGGRVYVAVRASGEVTFHEGYVTAREARRLDNGEAIETGAKAPRPELTGTMQTYIDLHRHAAVRAALTGHPKVALRLMVAHAIAGSHLWTVRVEPQTSRDEAVRESVETCTGETDFDAKRRAVLALLGFSPEEPTVTGGNSDEYGLVGVFLRLLALSDRAVMDVIAVVIGETLASGSAAVEAVGGAIGVDMARCWQADAAFFDALRDREVLTRIVAELAGEDTAAANAKEPGKALKGIVRDCLAGTNGRARVDGWVPRWMVFPPSAYTGRGGVGTLAAHAKVEAARAAREPEPAAPGAVIALPAPDTAEEQAEPQAEAERAAA